jgi:hypothetical protein
LPKNCKVFSKNNDYTYEWDNCLYLVWANAKKRSQKGQWKQENQGNQGKGNQGKGNQGKSGH